MTTTDWKNQLYFGDNLDILRNHVADASVDLIYLDPPFNSNANYNGWCGAGTFSGAPGELPGRRPDQALRERPVG